MHEQKTLTLEAQIDHLQVRLARIEHLAAKIQSTLGDWGWREQTSYLRKKHEPKQAVTTPLNWSEFLATSEPAPRKEILGHGIPQQTLNRLNDVNALVDSYAPLVARRLAAELTASERIAEIFNKYGFKSTDSNSTDKDRLSTILAGNAFPEHIDLEKEFKNWPCAAIGGSFAQELATTLDYLPSTWALARELEGQAASEPSGQGGVPPNPVPTDKAPKDRAWEAGLMGLAFSGGGIRSATFNLGILQGLAKLGLLHKFNYLSTVSGGGYIGSWLISWIKREGIGEVERRLCPDSTPDPRDLRLEPIRFLRDFSNYLTPRMGLLSADLWVMAVVWVRNTLLNLLILLPAMFAALLLPRVPEAWAQSVAMTHLKADGTLPFGYLYFLLLLILWIAVLVGLNLRQFPVNAGDVAVASVTRRQRFYSRPWGVLTFIVLPIFAAAWLASLELWSHAGDPGPWEWTSVGPFAAVMAAILLMERELLALL